MRGYTIILLKSLLALGLFGWIPGFYIVAPFFLTAYFLARTFLPANRPTWRSIRTSIIQAVRNRPTYQNTKAAIVLKVRQASQYLHNNVMEWPRRITRFSILHRWSILKGFIAFIILFSWSVPFSLLSIYGMYRLNQAEWTQMIQRRLDNAYHIIHGTYLGFNDTTDFRHRITLLAGGCIIMGAVFFLIGSGGLLIDFALTCLEISMTLMGLRALSFDLPVFLQNPIENIIRHAASLYGIVWGHRFSYRLFSGTISGRLPPATGQVIHRGLIYSIFSAFFPSEPSRFVIGATGLQALIGRVQAFIHNIVTSVFFSHNMTVHGDIYGFVGPGSFQILGSMVFGFLMGYCFEYLADWFVNDLLEHTEMAIQWVYRYVNPTQTPQMAQAVAVPNVVQPVVVDNVIETTPQNVYAPQFTAQQEQQEKATIIDDIPFTLEIIPSSPITPP